MAKPVDILILFEKAHRELDVACALKVLAERRGLSVEIIHQDYDYGEALSRFEPRVVVLPFCYQNRSNNIYLMRWRQAIFVNLTWEQFFYPGNKNAKTPRGEFPLNHVIHFSWSEAYSSLLREIGVPRERIFCSGNLALTLYRQPYCSYFKGREALAERYKLDPTKKWVFFPENYNWAFYDDLMLKQMVADGQTPQEVYAMRDFANRSFAAAMKWCKELVDQTNVELILRPRPATVLGEMRARVEEVVGPLPPRFHILQNETVREWILGSDLVISSYSTSLIEGAVAGRRILMLEPYPIPHSLAQAWHHLVPRAENFEQLYAAALDVDPESSRSSALSSWASSTLMANGDPISTSVEFLERLVRGEVACPPEATRASVTYGCPEAIPVSIWWSWKYLKSFLSQFKALSPFRRDAAADIQVDVAASRSISQRCLQWKACLPQ